MSQAQRIEAEAAEWLSRRVDPQWSEDDQAELDHWLGQEYSHKAAYWRLEEGWAKAGRIASLGLSARSAGGRFGGMRSAWKPALMAASIAGLLFVGARQLTHFGSPAGPRGQLVATAVGGHKIVPLDDGSKIELNTATVVRASVSPQSRDVWLDQGEAYFDVQHSNVVPFVVHAGPKTVTVLGTKFSVRRDGDNVKVAVEIGRVRVTDAKAAGDANETYVAAGSVAVSRPDETLVTQSSPQNVETDLAWRQGLLIFRNDTLAEAAAEFNRYNARKLVVGGKVAELKISGSFKAVNEEGFGRLLRDAYGLNVSTTNSEVHVTD